MIYELQQEVKTDDKIDYTHIGNKQAYQFQQCITCQS